MPAQIDLLVFTVSKSINYTLVATIHIVFVKTNQIVVVVVVVESDC